VTEPAEQRLRKLFHEGGAGATGEPTRLAAAALGHARHRRHVRSAAVIGTGLLVVAVGAVAGIAGGPGRNTPIAARSRPVPALQGSHAPDRDRAAGVASCVASYSTDTLAAQAFAFDGTVTGLGPARTNRSGRGSLPLVSAAFAVHEWFHGGSGATVSVDMTAPDAVMPETGVPSYAVGSRLLVSGMPRWGGAALDDPIAWGCGFTRRYDAATATAWRAAFGSRR
jgi:hypothetical protein